MEWFGRAVVSKLDLNVSINNFLALVVNVCGQVQDLSFVCLFSLNCCVGVTHTYQMMNWTYIKSLADTFLKIMKATGVFVLLLLLIKLQWVFKALVLKSSWFLTTLWFQKLMQNSFTHLANKTLKSCRHVCFSWQLLLCLG